MQVKHPIFTDSLFPHEHAATLSYNVNYVILYIYRNTNNHDIDINFSFTRMQCILI